MAKKASDITRILTCTIKIGRKVINLTEERHKTVLISLMNVIFSTVGNSDAAESSEEITSFLSDVDQTELGKYKFHLSDLVKEAEFTGATLQALTSVWGNVKVRWNVTRGGKRAVKESAKVRLSDLS